MSVCDLQRFNPVLVSSAPVEWKEKRLELKAKRDPLFARYLKLPWDTSPASEIKLLDDQMAECNEQLQRELRARN